MSVSDDELGREVSRHREEIQRIFDSRTVGFTDYARVEALRIRLVPMERELARRRQLPYAEKVAWPTTWGKNSYGPEVLSFPGSASIVYGANDVMNLAMDVGFGVVCFVQCSAMDATGASPHAHLNHPLCSSGLSDNGVYRVENSALLAAIISLHGPETYLLEENYRPAHWLFSFESMYVESIARDARHLGVFARLEDARDAARKAALPL